jgi:predicted tellurium resistance membrane protein TerC
MKIIEWIIANKEWIFSGIGVLVITIVLNLIFRKKSEKQIQKSGRNSKNYQAGNNITINKDDK